MNTQLRLWVESKGNGRAVLFKTDTNGEIVWVRRIGKNGVGYRTFNLLACADGGFAFDGEGYPLGTYLFKTDSAGHLPCSEAASAPVATTEIFPSGSAIALSSIDGAITHTGYITDTSCMPFAALDGCAVAIRPLVATSLDVTVRPNPTTGRIMMDFADPLLADSFYSVYDAVGKLLFQRPLHAGQESEEIDLSRFGSGTYVVRITSKDGVCNERVVVQ